MNKVEFEAAKIEVDKLLKTNAIVESHREQNDFVSNVFLCPKKDGGYRMILNLKNFNTYAEKVKFKMETLQSILHLVTPGCWMTILDLLDAYLSIPVLPAHRIWLNFIFQGKIYMFKVLPFGYTWVPQIFTKLLKPLIAHLRKCGITVTFYLDDSWQSAATYKGCVYACFTTVQLLLSCGFLPNMKKSILKPQQQITVLGTIVDSITMMVSLPQVKEHTILELLNNALKLHHMSVRHLAKIIGKLISCTAVCPLGKLY